MYSSIWARGLRTARRWHRPLVLAWLLGGLAAPQAAEERPARIASLNLCTDQLVLMLVDRQRIASLTVLADRPESSYMAALAEGIPGNQGLAEEEVPLAPDLVIATSFTDPLRLALLRRLGIRVERVDPPGRLDEVAAHLREVAEMVGEQARGEELVAAMEERLEALRSQAAARPPRRAAVYGPNGVTAGAGTMLDDLMTAAGLRNLAAEQGGVGYRHLALEQLLAWQPEVLVLEAAEATGGASLAHRPVPHPALRALRQQLVTVALPAPLADCVGPMVVDALALLVAA